MKDKFDSQSELRMRFESAVECLSTHEAKIAEIENSFINLLENLKPIMANGQGGPSRAEVSAL